MVDRLVTASQQRKALPAGPPVERQLTPYFVHSVATVNPGLGDINVALCVSGERGAADSGDLRTREDAERTSGAPNGTAGPGTPPQKRTRSRQTKGQEAQVDASSSPPSSQRTLRLVPSAAEAPGVTQQAALPRRISSEPSASTKKRPASAKPSAPAAQPSAPAAPPAAKQQLPPKVARAPPVAGAGAQAPWAGYGRAPDPGALPLPSFGRCQSDSAVPALLNPAPPPALGGPPFDAADASAQLRRMLSIHAAAPAPPPRAEVAAQHTLALRQLLGVAAC